MNYRQNKEKVWAVRYTPGNSEADAIVNTIASETRVSSVCAKLMYNRGIRAYQDVEGFLISSVDKLYDPMLMTDMDRAVERIETALESHEKMTVYGDYDVDGVTAVTLIYLYLKSRGADIDYYIPSRSKEGYGLSRMALDTLKQQGTEFIVTVDTGITANDEAEYARELGIDMVITDHHECHGELPSACAVVNPHRADCNYPFKELAGVGVVFKLVCALEINRCADKDRAEAIDRVCREYLDLVAIGTIADVMPLINENRIIVRHGLAYISATERCGLAALIDAANNSFSTGARTSAAEKGTVKKRKINAGYIGFTLAPRINAAGRISSAEKAVELLLCNDPEVAAEKASELCEINLRRQIEENGIAEEAYRMIEEKHDFSRDKVIVLDGNTWQQGIIGIVSSRITEKYGLPSILVSFDGAVGESDSPEDMGKGSGRSVKGMNLVEALSYCEELLVRFGGHELAAGLTVKRENVDAFRRKINEYAEKTLGDEAVAVKYEADCELFANEIDLRLAAEISVLEPFGVANESPLFLVRELSLDKVIPMGAGKHTKLLLSLDGKEVQAIFFGMPTASLDYYPGEKVDILCRININEFRGKETLQLVIQDIRLSPSYAETENAQRERYEAICASALVPDTDDIPERDDVAEIYRVLKYEIENGNSTFTFRSFSSRIHECYGKCPGYSKLRFALDILNDMNVCCIHFDGDSFEAELCRTPQKSSVESTKTYIKLKSR